TAVRDRGHIEDPGGVFVGDLAFTQRAQDFQGLGHGCLLWHWWERRTAPGAVWILRKVAMEVPREPGPDIVYRSIGCKKYPTRSCAGRGAIEARFDVRRPSPDGSQILTAHRLTTPPSSVYKTLRTPLPSLPRPRP